ncbi:hypothetical protein ABEB36_001620 [Hypothenemus hampei]|uniref:Luciferin 4-monooxygenase n=1 Tax=Hypothenemus hampei TaxID=57062 RepID=A0ABD1FF57_HYPHA
MDSHAEDIFLDTDSKEIFCLTTYGKLTKGLGYNFFQDMCQYKERTAQFIAKTEETDTYQDLLTRSIRTALHLKTKILKRTDVIALCTYNHENSCVPFIASQFLGLKVASLDPSFTVGEASYLIDMIKPKILFVVAEAVETIAESLEKAELQAEVVVFGEEIDNSTFTSFASFLEECPDEDAFEPEVVDANETAVIFFSSGTTGMPKGICISHKSLYHQALITQYCGLIVSDEIILSYSSLYWISATMLLTCAIVTGSARVICQKFDPEQIWILLDKYKVTYLFLAPIQAHDMLHFGRSEGLDTCALQVMITGGGHCSNDQLFTLRDMLPGTFVFQCYGCTEVAGAISMYNLNKVNDRLLLYHRPSSCGRPLPGFTYKVVNVDTGEACGVNETGELRIKSEFCLNSYYNQDSTSAFDEEGWLRTGDVVYYDRDFCFYVVGRIKEMLKYRSWHVQPALLEGILQQHPAVKQCIVVGIPHPVDGDHPVGVVVVHEDHLEDVTAEEIQDFVAKRVNDTHKLRGGVRFIDELPLTPSGKIKRKLVQDMVLKGLI